MNLTPTVYEVSLIAAYIAGMVALFAPCCISYLLPAYLGNVFKEKRRILFMTFIYSLGIFTVLMPIVIGAKALASFFFDYHNQTYLFGGGLMILVAFLALFGFKLPMPRFNKNQTGTDLGSTYTLGIISGITSACCAPVLIGVLALSSLSPSLPHALSVGALYVLGMVTPLYLAGLFIHKKNLLAKPVLKKALTTLKFGRKSVPILVSNLVAFVVFFLTGWFLIILTLTGQLGMNEKTMAASQTIANTATRITAISDAYPFLNYLFLLAAVVLLGLFFKAMRRENKLTVDQESCCQDPPASAKS
jgi:cytochrome c-type biogenesis protein